MTHFPRPWWYSLALRIVPSRCREIPEAQNPDRIVLRQVALVQNRRAWQLACMRRIEVLRDTAYHEVACGRLPPWRDGWALAFWRAVFWLASFANVYLQQFASDEDPRFMHSHPYRRMFAIGLWGGYAEHRIAGESRRRRAPYFYTMDGGHVHHVQQVTAGHTSIFVGLHRAVDGSIGDKHYYGVPVRINAHVQPGEEAAAMVPFTYRSLWSDHIKVQVKRI